MTETTERIKDDFLDEQNTIHSSNVSLEKSNS